MREKYWRKHDGGEREELITNMKQAAACMAALSHKSRGSLSLGDHQCKPDTMRWQDPPLLHYISWFRSSYKVYVALKLWGAGWFLRLFSHCKSGHFDHAWFITDAQPRCVLKKYKLKTVWSSPQCLQVTNTAPQSCCGFITRGINFTFISPFTVLYFLNSQLELLVTFQIILYKYMK